MMRACLNSQKCRGWIFLARAASALALSLASLALTSALPALARGFNAETFYPNIDRRSGVMLETPLSLPQGGLMFAYTLSYALRPIEFGNGSDVRIPVNDHLQVNHVGVGYGILPWLDAGLELPIAGYQATRNEENFIAELGSVPARRFFQLADMKARVKLSLSRLFEQDAFHYGAVLSAWVPVGSRQSLLSDDTSRFALEFPVEVPFMGARGAVTLTPGLGFWGDAERLTAVLPGARSATTLLHKSRSLLLALGGRFWILGGEDGGLQVDGAVRGDFEGYKPSFGRRESPVEWAAGGSYAMGPKLSFHGSYGAGIGVGAGAPLSRLAAGVRYLFAPDENADSGKQQELGPSSEAYSERELEEIFEQAARENPRDVAPEEETILRLLVNNEIIDIGTVNFEFNSSRLTLEAKRTVKLLFDQLVRIKPRSVKIDGHTDSVGSYQYNLALSKRRADAVRAELVRLGIAGGMVATEGFAFKFPIASNATQEGRTRNRRIEVSLDGKSFRKGTYSREELEMFRRWVYPGGKQPKANQDGPE